MTTKAKRSIAKDSTKTRRAPNADETRGRDTDVQPRPGERSDEDAIGRPVQLDEPEIGRPVQLDGQTEDTPKQRGAGAERSSSRSDRRGSEH